MAIDFGFYPHPYNRTLGRIEVSTLPDLDAKVAGIKAHEWVQDRWFCVPRPHRVFRLPKTHSISCTHPTPDEHLQFLIWCFGFFVGMRVTSTEAGFLDATPLHEGAMTDISWLEHSLDKAVAGADAFWRKHANSPRVAKILTGVVHAYFLAQTRGLLEYEQFIYLYMALDGCHAVRETIAGRVPHKTLHADRIGNLCTAFGIVADSAGRTIPTWAARSTDTQPAITALRNDTLHEGLFFDEPLGFQGFGGENVSPHVIGSMIALVSRLIVALLELPAQDYIRSPLTSGTMEGVRL